MKKITLNNLIEIILFLYILSLYLLTYRENLNLISNALALMLIASIGINSLLTRRNPVFNRTLFLFTTFISFCLLSTFTAINQDTALTRVKTLVLILVLMFALINYLNTFKKIRNVMIYFAFSGFIASIYILLTSDFSQISRFGDELGNLNAVGIMIGISAAFCFYFIVVEKKYLFLFLLLIMFAIILLTGSRQALLFILITLVVILYLQSRDKGLSNKLKFILISAFIIIISFYIIFNNSFLYQIIGVRIESSLSIITGGSSNEGSIPLRAYMIELGIEMFKDRPFFGYGIDNYRHLLGSNLSGVVTYSHNNFIELLVGTGIFGVITFYLMHIFTIVELFISSNNNKKNTYSYVFIAILIGYFILTISSVYYYNKHFLIILAISSVISRILKSSNKVV